MNEDRLGRLKRKCNAAAVDHFGRPHPAQDPAAEAGEMIGIEHHFTVGSNHGLSMELDFASDANDALALLHEAMQRDGWSDSVLVAVDRLPSAAREDWEQRKEQAARTSSQPWSSAPASSPAAY